MSDLFERFLAEAQGVQPTKLDGSAAFARLRAASSAERHAFFSAYVRDTRAGRRFAEERGGFILVALGRALAELLADDALPWQQSDLDALLEMRRAFWPQPRLARVLALLDRFGFSEARLARVLAGNEATPEILARAYAQVPTGEATWARHTREQIARLDPDAQHEWRAFARDLLEEPPGYHRLERWVADRADDLDAAIIGVIVSALRLVEAPASYATVSSESGLTRADELDGLLLEAFATLVPEVLHDASERATILARLARAAFTRVADLGAWRPRLGYRCLDLLAREAGEAAAEALRVLAAELPYPRAARYAASRA